MFLESKYITSLLTILFLKRTVRAWEFSPVEDNVVITTEMQIRSIMTTITQMLNIATECAGLLEYYFTLHNNLLTSALQEADKWQEIVEAAEVNVSGEMKEIVTEIINEYTNYRDVTNISVHNDKMIRQIDAFLQELDVYNVMYSNDIAIQSYVQNGLIMKNSSSDEAYPDSPEQSIETIHENETDFSEFWTPENLLETSGRRIYASTVTKVSRFPFMAAIIIFGHFHCAGSIISKDLVLTAASGVQLAHNNRMFRENPSFLAVRVGSTFHSIGGDLISVLQIYFHPSYDPQTLNNNICLLRLVRHIRFRNKRHRDKKVKKIAFDKRDTPLPNNIPEVVILGWGAKSIGNKIPLEGNLRYARLNLYAHRDCQDIYTKKYVTIQNFCAGFVTKGSGACNQDVGDPGIINGVLYGIVSFGAPQCGAPDSPTVFTKVGFYSDWIETIMEQEIPFKSRWRTTTGKFIILEEEDVTETTYLLQPIGTTNSKATINEPEVESKTEPNARERQTTESESDQETTKFNVGRTAMIVDNDKEPKKKNIHKKKTTPDLFDYYAPLILPDYSNTEINIVAHKKNKKKHKKGTTKLKKIVPSKSHHYHHTDFIEWKPTKTTQKLKKIKKSKNKHLTANDYEKTTLESAFLDSYEILTEEYVHKTSKKIKSIKNNKKDATRTNRKPKKNKHHKKSKKSKDDAHMKLLHNIHVNTKTKYFDYNETNSEPIYYQNSLGTSTDANQNDTENSKSWKTHKDYSESNAKYYDNLDMYQSDYSSSYDGKTQIQNKKILETLDYGPYNTLNQSGLKMKTDINSQSNKVSNPLEEETYDYKEYSEYDDKDELVDDEYGSPEIKQVPKQENDYYYNSDEYYNNHYEKDRNRAMELKQATRIESGFDPVKSNEKDLPQDLEKLESHELKLMFLEQLAKQSGDMPKMTVNRSLNTDSSFPEQSLQTRPTHTNDKDKKDQNKDTGFYDLMRSAFNEIELKFKQAAITSKRPQNIRRTKKAWYERQ